MCVYKNVIFIKEPILRLWFTVRMIQLQPQCKVDYCLIFQSVVNCLLYFSYFIKSISFCEGFLMPVHVL